MKLSLERIAEWCESDSGRNPGVLIESYSTDTRTIAPGALYIALIGPNHDGHDYVSAAFERGAAAALVSRRVEAAGPLLLVEDTLAALQRLARKAREAWGRAQRRTVIGITGSAGKTTTKDAVAAVLATRFRTGKTTGNFNNHIGVPLSVLHLPDDADVAVLEIGMNHAGEIRDLCRIAQPGIGLVTNIGTAHIEAFESIDGIALAKRELVEALPPEGTAILNADDERVRRFASIHPGRSLLYGASSEAGIRAEDVKIGVDGSRFRLDGAEFACPLPARGGMLTALSALACAKALGLDPAAPDIRDAIASLHPPKMRLERIDRGGVTIWNDCYNSNPEAAKMMVELLAATPAQRRIAVLGEMRELGRWSEELHREVGAAAAKAGIDEVVGIHGFARSLVDAAVESGLPAGSARFFEESPEAGLFLRRFARAGDAVLFKGSRGTRVELALEEYLK
jgi:UDP-N-acetylmuramoyl-tripeptide--D-alanyl-D-alanine ligase